jgi:chromosome segregation ATPase
MIKEQISKWSKLQSTHEDELNLKSSIAKLEKDLYEATQNEDYEKASELQAEIDKISQKLKIHEQQRFVLEEITKSKREEFLHELKEDINRLIEIECQLSSEKNKLQLNSNLEYQKTTIEAKFMNLEEMEKELNGKITSAEDKLNEFNEK